MTNTPRVDEFCKTSGGQYTYDLSGLARHLERELAAAHKALRIANASADDQMFQKREAEAQRDKALVALNAIKEYWNQDRNEKDMFYACWFAKNTAEEVLKECWKEEKTAAVVFKQTKSGYEIKLTGAGGGGGK